MVVSPRREFLSYDGYLKALKRYCLELGLKDLATHGLRHSASEIWISHGASDGDMQALFAHSCGQVTDRYIHYKGVRRLEKFANVIRQFPEAETDEKTTASQKLPKSASEPVDATTGVC